MISLDGGRMPFHPSALFGACHNTSYFIFLPSPQSLLSFHLLLFAARKFAEIDFGFVLWERLHVMSRFLRGRFVEKLDAVLSERSLFCARRRSEAKQFSENLRNFLFTTEIFHLLLLCDALFFPPLDRRVLAFCKHIHFNMWFISDRKIIFYNSSCFGWVGRRRERESRIEAWSGLWETMAAYRWGAAK